VCYRGHEIRTHEFQIVGIFLLLLLLTITIREFERKSEKYIYLRFHSKNSWMTTWDWHYG